MSKFRFHSAKTTKTHQKSSSEDFINSLIIAIKFLLFGKLRKLKTYSFLKDKNPHIACQIYEGVCSCGQNYIGETERNVSTRWAEHENVNLWYWADFRYFPLAREDRLLNGGVLIM